MANYLRIPVLFLVIMCSLNLASSKAFAPVSADSTDSTVTETQTVQFISSPQEHIHEVSFWGGYSIGSPHLWGKTRDVSMQYFGMRYNRKFLNFYGTEVEYMFKISIYSEFSYPMFVKGRPRNSISGFGITPLGFQINFRDDKTIQPFLNTTGGFVFLNQPFPDRRGKKFNFTFGIAGGIEIMLSHSVSLSLGLRYHHLSNGELGQVNPGIDSSIFYTAITLF
ncbi:MAG TPA: acyloxyacyl hydrolase [Balneolaceae bacterium]